MIRLIALDLDGTLLNPDLRLSPVDGEAVVAARERGVQISLATARWYARAESTAGKLGLKAPLICHNGSHVQEPDNGPELLHLRIPQDAAREIAAFCDDGGFETYTTVDGTTYIRAPWEAQIAPKRLPKDMRVEHKHAERVTGSATGFVIFGEEAVNAVVDAFAGRYADTLSFPVGASEGSRPYVSVTPAGADKGRALTIVCQNLGIPPEETMAVGDAAPDLAMFDVARVGVAMGNASDDVKAKADAVAPSNAEGGVAWALRRFVLDAE